MTFYADLIRKGRTALIRGWKPVLCATLLSMLPALVQGVLTGTHVLSRGTTSGLILTVLLLLCSLLFVPGLIIICLKLLRGEKAGLRDLLEGLRRFGRFLAADLLFSLMVTGLLLVFLVPFVLSGAPRRVNIVFWMEAVAFIAGFLWLFSLYGLFPKTVVDQDVRGPVAVLRRSRELTRGFRWRFLGLNVLFFALSLLTYLLGANPHPGVIALRWVITFVNSVLNPMLTCAFYEAICNPGADGTGPQKDALGLSRGDETTGEEVPVMSEAKPLPGWYSRLYHRRLTVCLWLLVAACVIYLVQAVPILGSLTSVQILGCLYVPGLAFFLWTGLKSLKEGSREKAIAAAVLYLVWYILNQMISAEWDFRILSLFFSSFFVTSAFAAGLAFLAHILWGEKRFGFIPFLLVLLLLLSDVIGALTTMPNFGLMMRYGLSEPSVVISYLCETFSRLLLTAAFAVGLLPARFGSRIVEEAEQVSYEPEDEDNVTEDE